MPDVTVATITLARTPAEEATLLAALERLAACGLPVVAADGGSRVAFRERLGALPGFQVREVPGTGPRLVKQVQEALAGALLLEPRYVLYTEPDKQGFFECSLRPLLDELPREAGAGLLIPSRSPESFATFPAGQHLTETLFNDLAAGMVGTPCDLLYGPLLIRADLVRYVRELQEADLGWGWRTFLIAVCSRLGEPIACREMDLPCPEEQRGEDDERSRVYRLQQLAQNVRGLALGMSLPLDR